MRTTMGPMAGSGDKYYQHSGQLNAPGLLAGVFGGLVAAVVLGWAYALCVRYVPEIKLNAIACGCFGVFVGLAPAELMRRLKVRNVAVSMAVVLAAAVAGLYVAWAAWEWLLFSHVTVADFFSLVARPQRVVDIGWRLYERGTWRLSSSDKENTKGPFLGVIWAVEALTVLVAALVAGRAVLRSKPFCERCDRWCDGPTVVRRTAWADPADVRQKMEAGDFTAIANLGPADPAKHLEFSQYRCGGCGQLNTLSALARTEKRDKKGRVRGKTAKRFVDKLLVSPADLQKLVPPPPPVPTSVTAAAAALRGG